METPALKATSTRVAESLRDGPDAGKRLLKYHLYQARVTAMLRYGNAARQHGDDP
jgi:hypothetical protein